VEYFCWLRSDADAPDDQAARDVVAAGPLQTPLLQEPLRAPGADA
jgi:23S rRNA (cytidine1920-2'-O)/16S rRNA (cytidine1409-2'-O)-methyltransferase